MTRASGAAIPEGVSSAYGHAPASAALAWHTSFSDVILGSDPSSVKSMKLCRASTLKPEKGPSVWGLDRAEAGAADESGCLVRLVRRKSRHLSGASHRGRGAIGVGAQLASAFKEK